MNGDLTLLFKKSLSESTDVQQLWEFYGFKNPGAADKNFILLAEMLEGDINILKNNLSRIFALLKGLADPDLAFKNFIAFLERTSSVYLNFRLVTQDLNALKLLLRLFSDSQYFSDLLIRRPALFDWLLEEGVAVYKNYDQLLEDARSTINVFTDPQTKIMSLRRFQKREFLRIGTNDLLLKSSLENTTSELSHLADVCIQCIYEIKKEELIDDDTDLAVFAMGKMGGEELNYSSDIDIIFIGKGDLQKACRVASEIVKALSVFTEEGTFYRVDTRLRPEGDRGTLAPGINGFESYFNNRARIWERQAYLKARFSAGDEALGAQLEKLIHSFVFRKYLSMSEIHYIKKLKKQIEAKALKNQQWMREVKIGYGGIRDVEFFVQLIQLLYGGKYPQIRSKSTLEALRRFQKLEFISFDEYESLSRHYIFLRRIEHFLQIMEYRQTHLLPKEPVQKKVLSKKLGFSNLEAFENRYHQTTDEVRKIFKKYFEELFENNDENLIDNLEHKEQFDEEADKILKYYGFEETKKTFRLIKNTEMNAKNQMLFFSFLEQMCLVLKELPFASDKGLLNILRIIQAYKGENVFFDILKSNPSFLELLAKIASFSDFMVEIIERKPAVLDFLTEPAILEQSTNASQIKQIFKILSKDMPLEDAFSALYEMEVFRIGTQDIMQLNNWEQINYNLSILAESILYLALGQFENPPAFAVILFGKFAGREISFNSDLDIVVVSDSDDFEDINQITKALTQIIKMLKKVYEIDLRLRPNGKNAPLIVSKTAFSKYLLEKGENWERLIYSRHKIYTKSDSLKKFLENTIHEFLGKEDLNTLKSDIISMRERITKNFPRHNFKKFWGGIMDIEFILEYLMIKNNILEANLKKVLDILEKEGNLEPDFLNNLKRGYSFLRKVENTIRLHSNQYSSELPKNMKSQTLLALKMGYPNYSEFFVDYQIFRKNIKKSWDFFVKNNL